MDIKTLESFSLGDAIFFHDDLNKNLWDMNNQLRPEVKKQLIVIAKDFIEELGVKDLDVKDITVSGSNAAYTYTKHSDLDLHILVDMDKLPEDEVYRELFTAKKNLYNDSHDIKVHGVPVELYVQDSNEPVVSLGEYSILKDKWLRIPTKRRANFDQTITKQKYKKLLDLIEKALKVKDIEKVENVISTIKRYRKAGLDRGGEFGPENLAYKALRTQGYIDKLYDLRDKLHSADLSIDEAIFYKDPSQLIDLYLRKVDSKNLSKTTLTKILQGIPYSNLDKALELFSKKYNIKPTDVVWQPSDSTNEDYDPNGPPPGPEFKPTMPAGTVRVDVSDVYDWYKLGQHISNMKGLGKHDFGKGPPSTIMAFGSEPEEHKYIKDLEKTGLTTTDIDPVDKNQPKGMKRQKVDPTFNVLDEAKMSIRSQIINDVQKNGPGEYFVRFTDSDKLGFSQKQMFGKTPDIGDTTFDVDNIGQNTGRRVLWFYPLSYYLKNYKDVYASEQPYVWLVKLKPNAWLQKVKRGDTKKVEAPLGKQRVGILRMSDPPAALFFSHGYDLIGKYQDYSKQHISHGQVKGCPEPSFFDKVRGLEEVLNTKPGKKNSAYWEHEGEEGSTLHFEASNGLEYRLDIIPMWMGADEARPWEFADTTDEQEEHGRYVEFSQVGSDWVKDITGTGSSAEIFGIVSNGILQYVKKFKPPFLMMQAAEMNRRRLYNAMLTRLLPLMPGYKSMGPKSDGMYFIYDSRVIKPKVSEEEKPKQASKSAIYSTDVYGMTAYHSKCLEPGCDWESKRYDSIKLAQNAAQKHAQKHFKKGVAESASGYIPSNAEKDDPRFKTALTVDIKPDTMKKDAKKFGNKISRAGIPPTLNPNGKF